MRKSPKRYVPDFGAKFRLARLAVGESEDDELQKTYAIKVFPTYKRSAAAQLSACIGGTAHFPAERLGVLLEKIDRRGVLKGISMATWLGSLAQFRSTLISSGLLDPSACAVTSLDHRLMAVSSAAQLFQLIKEFRRTHEVVNEFGKAISSLPKSEVPRLERFLHQLITEQWRATTNIQSIGLAAEILARMANQKLSQYGLECPIEQEINTLDAFRVAVVDPLCYLGMRHGQEACFAQNIRRMIEDPRWRAHDLAVHKVYYGGLERTGWHLDRHFAIRPPAMRAHDIGKVIAVYPELFKRPDTAILAESLKDEALNYAKQLGLDRPLRTKLENLLRP